MVSKFCKHCNSEHPFTPEFWRISGKAGTCKIRIKEYNQKYTAANKPRYQALHVKWRAANLEKCKADIRKYYYLNRTPILEKKNIRDKAKRQTNVEFKLACTLRIRMANALRRHTKTGSAVRDLGCSIDEFKQHIESQFRDGMNWDNHGSHWHLDHILPLANYQLSDRGTFRRLAHYTNYQPLLVSENLTKSNKED